MPYFSKKGFVKLTKEEKEELKREESNLLAAGGGFLIDPYSKAVVVFKPSIKGKGCRMSFIGGSACKLDEPFKVKVGKYLALRNMRLNTKLIPTSFFQ